MEDDASTGELISAAGASRSIRVTPDGHATGLEELDGTPIGAVPRGEREGRRAGGVGAALGLAVGRPSLWLFALVAFLVRGGLLLVLAPILSLPTFIGLANMIGPTSVTAAGPTERLSMIVVVAIAIVVVAIVTGTLIAAAAETALYRATVAGDPDDPSSGLLAADATPQARQGVLRVAVVRLLLLVPVVLVISFGVPEYVAVGYRELLLPADLSTPLPVRILLGAPGPSLLLGVAWLLGEVIGGYAARRVVFYGSGSLRALGAAIVDLATAPAGVLLALVVGLGASAILVVPALVAASLAWDGARVALVDGRAPASILLGVFLLAGAWGISLLLAGVAAGIRSVLFTGQLVRRRRGAPGTGTRRRGAS